MNPVKVKYCYAYKDRIITVHVPETYSEDETKAFAEKIFRSLGVPADKNLIEII